MRLPSRAFETVFVNRRGPLSKLSMLASIALAAIAFVPVACGPSFQAIYEGDAHFEKCYALDESPQAALDKKSACWDDWSRRYTYGQTRDRIDYARSRHNALSRVADAPTDESIMAAAPGGGDEKSNVSAPMPTSAFAPPPKTLNDNATDGGLVVTRPSFTLPSAPSAVSSAPPTPTGPTEPESYCSSGCSEAWRSCGDRCKGAACDACPKDYRKCMRACFKDDGAKKKPAPAAAASSTP